jgi:hypothetical protein
MIPRPRSTSDRLSQAKSHMARRLARHRLHVAVMLLLTACAAETGVVFLPTLRRKTQAGVYVEEVPLWEPGFKVRGRRGNRRRVRMRWRDRVAQIGTETEFRARYKVSSRMFMEICNKIRGDVEAGDRLQAERGSGGLISAELHLSIALRYMAGGHYLDIADLHGVHSNQVCKSVNLVARSINRHFAGKLRFPIHDRQALDTLAAGFYKESGYTTPGCIGCVDGIVIPIEKPRWGEVVNINDMWNRKGCYAIVCQAICDHQLRFMWTSSGCTGNTNDSLAWECSKLSRHLLKKPLPKELWIAGDDAYKGSGQIVTPYPGSALAEEERAFNFFHSRTRMHIERAFGVWKERWGMFHRPSCLSLKNVMSVVKCTMILHNMCIDNNVAPTTFRGTRRELSDVWPGDEFEVIFNDLTPAELRNIVDVPYAARDWIKGLLQDQGVVAPDPHN